MNIIADNCVCSRINYRCVWSEFNYTIEIAQGGLDTQLSAMISFAVFVIFDGYGLGGCYNESHHESIVLLIGYTYATNPISARYYVLGYTI